MCHNDYNIKVGENKHLTRTEREYIEYWYNLWQKEKYKLLNPKEKEKIKRIPKTKKEIASILNKHPRTISREIKRGTFYKYIDKLFKEIPFYSAEKAQKDYDYKAGAKGPNMILNVNIQLADHVEKMIVEEKRSPEVIVAELAEYGFNEKAVCAKTIRNAIKDGNIFLNIEYGNVFYKTNGRKQSGKPKKSKKTPPEKSIENRPDEIEARSTYGHWEGDLVLGKKEKGPALLTLTERKSRYIIIKKLESKESRNVIKALDDIEFKLGDEFSKHFKTITFDNGSEFLDFNKMERSIFNKNRRRTTIYYAHPYCSYERGSNENNNRLIRRHEPKGKSFDNLTEERVKYIENWINEYPRLIFRYKSAKEKLKEHIINI